MSLKLGINIPNIFTHGGNAGDGFSKQNINKTEIVVSLDGTGDTDRIEEALKLTSNDGGKILIKEGRYKIDEEIVISKNNIIIEGNGDGTIIDLLNQTINGFNLTNVTNVKISKIKFENHGDWSSSTGFIKLDYTTYIKISECFFNDSSATGILIRNTTSNQISQQIEIKNCKFISNRGILSAPNVTAGNFNKYIWILDNYAEPTFYFVYTSSSQKFYIRHNEVTSGYLCYGEDGTSFNNFHGNTAPQIYLEGDSNKNRITDNYFTNDPSIELIDNGTKPDRNVLTGNNYNTTITDQGTNTVNSNNRS